VVALLFFFPVLWMALEGLKTEVQAAAIPPIFVFAHLATFARSTSAMVSWFKRIGRPAVAATARANDSPDGTRSEVWPKNTRSSR
jgi:ABC-type glycerol-3-phosphate transport system permease component